MSDDSPRAPRQRAMTRSDVARRLGVSISTVRRMEGKQLHPKLSKDHRRLFDAEEVEQLANTRPASTKGITDGEIAARAFEMFEKWYDVSDVVRALRQPPSAIRELYREWKTPLGVGLKRQRDEARRAREAEDTELQIKIETHKRREDQHLQKSMQQQERLVAQMDKVLSKYDHK